MHDQFLPFPIEANRDRFAKTKKISNYLHVTFAKPREYEITVLFSILRQISFTKIYFYCK